MNDLLLYPHTLPCSLFSSWISGMRPSSLLLVSFSELASALRLGIQCFEVLSISLVLAHGYLPLGSTCNPSAARSTSGAG